MYKNMFIFAYRSVKSVGHHSKKKLFSLSKMAPYHVLLGKMPLFQPILGPLGNDPKMQKFHFLHVYGVKTVLYYTY